MAVRFQNVGDRLTRARYNGVYGRPSATDSAQDYTVYFKYLPVNVKHASDGYNTVFTAKDGPYNNAVWIGLDVTQELTCETYSEGTNYDTVQVGYTLGVEINFAYTRAGTTHTFYVNGMQVAQWTQAAPDAAFTSTWVGGDDPATSTRGGWVLRRFREWEGTALTPTQLNAEAASATAVLTTNLYCDIPFTDPNDYLDVSGHAHHLTLYRSAMAGSPGTAFVDDPVLPLSSNYTQFAWVRGDITASTFQGMVEIVDTEVSGGAWSAIQRAGGTSVYAGLQTPGGSPTSVGSSAAFPNGKWVAVAIVQQGTTLNFFVNGVLNASGTHDYAGALAHAINLGHFGGNAGIRVAFARFWTAALPGSEVIAEALSPTPVRTTSLFAAYPLQTNYKDASGNFRDLLLGGGAVTFVADPFVVSTPVETVAVTDSASGFLRTIDHAALPVVTDAAIVTVTDSVSGALAAAGHSYLLAFVDPLSQYTVIIQSYQWGFTEATEFVTRDFGTTPFGTWHRQATAHVIQQITVRFAAIDDIIDPLQMMTMIAQRHGGPIQFYPDAYNGDYRWVEWPSEVPLTRVIENREEIELVLRETGEQGTAPPPYVPPPACAFVRVLGGANYWAPGNSAFTNNNPYQNWVLPPDPLYPEAAFGHRVSIVSGAVTPGVNGLVSDGGGEWGSRSDALFMNAARVGASLVKGRTTVQRKITSLPANHSNGSLIFNTWLGSFYAYPMVTAFPPPYQHYHGLLVFGVNPQLRADFDFTPLVGTVATFRLEWWNVKTFRFYVNDAPISWNSYAGLGGSYAETPIGTDVTLTNAVSGTLGARFGSAGAAEETFTWPVGDWTIEECAGGTGTGDPPPAVPVAAVAVSQVAVKVLVDLPAVAYVSQVATKVLVGA